VGIWIGIEGMEHGRNVYEDILDVLGRTRRITLSYGQKGQSQTRLHAQISPKTNIQSTPKCGDCGLDLPGIPALRPRECES
jgi:ribosomal protein L34E